MKSKVAKISGLLVCIGLLACLATLPVHAYPNKPTCSNCHGLDPGTSISLDVSRTETLMICDVSGSDNYNSEEGWAVFDTVGNNIANGYYAGTFQVPRDGATYRVFWVDDADPGKGGSAFVDIVADGYSDADFNGDGVVNFLDYAVLASAWQTTPADGNYNDICDLVDDNSIDHADLALFVEDWLWMAD